YGSPEAASRAWFAGPGGMNNTGAKDVLGTTVADYSKKFTAGMGAPGPQVAQGDNTQADGSGNAIPPAQPQINDYAARDLTAALPPGARFVTRGGKFNIQNDIAEIMLPDGSTTIMRLPPKKEATDKGLFGDSLTGRALNALRTLTPETQEYAAAYAILSKPQVVFDQQTGQQRVIQPMDLSMFPRPAFAGGATPAAAPPVDGATTAQIPGGGTVTTTPGKGKPLDNSARDDLTKASGGVLELGELVKSFDPSFGGYRVDALGESANFAKRNLPDFLGGADEKGQAQWWQRYSMFANLERNKLFGSALTPGETAAFNAAMVSPGMKPDQIRINLERQRDIASKALSRIVNSMVESGYNAGAIEAATGIKIGELPSPIGGTPQAPTADKGKQQFDLKKKYGLE
ncbi:MAG TPA: hypothetical protein VM760_07395, partial [Sphingomicrobium sp.]|nr:hypothetical protein [Sphingomicrobium sp.]